MGFWCNVISYIWPQVVTIQSNCMFVQHGSLVCNKLSNVSLSAVAGWPESDLKPLQGSPSVCSVTEADVWPSEPAGLLLCVHWCPNAQSQGPTHSSLVLHNRKTNQMSHKTQYTVLIIDQGDWSLWQVLVNVLQIVQWKCDVCTSVLNLILILVTLCTK